MHYPFVSPEHTSDKSLCPAPRLPGLPTSPPFGTPLFVLTVYLRAGGNIWTPLTIIFSRVNKIEATWQTLWWCGTEITNTIFRCVIVFNCLVFVVVFQPPCTYICHCCQILLSWAINTCNTCTGISTDYYIHVISVFARGNRRHSYTWFNTWIRENKVYMWFLF